MVTIDEQPTETADHPRGGRGAVARAAGLLRRSWRQLTSMRTALVLLFLLAVAAIPGSLLPQRNVSVEKVRAFLAAHPTAGPLIDRASGFNVYGSPWFSAIYLLLFASLVGCLVPRLRSHAVALWRRPPPAPRRLDRLPAYAVVGTGPVDQVAVADRLRAMLRGQRFRVTVRQEAPGTVTLSAEKGYLKETGNLLFHFALLGLLAGVAYGSLGGWHANRLLVAGAENSFCNSMQQYDEYGLGAAVDGSDLPPFCLRLDSFRGSYLDNGQPVAFDATIGYRWAGGGGAERTRRVSVNSPLRLSGANVYLLGHGYAPVLRYTDRYGRTQPVTAPVLPRDGALTSDGVALFPDANLDPRTGRPDELGQIGFNGVYLPTVPPDPAVGRSLHPAERDPGLMLQAYRGDLGLDAGTPLSVYTLDARQLRAGRLSTFDQPHLLRPGETWTLSDSSRVEFLGTRPWVALSVRWDPGERVVLGGAVCLLIGLLVSLTGRRRRVWLRVTADQVTAGGLPRNDDQTFAVEFAELVRRAGEQVDDDGSGELRREGHTGTGPTE